MKNILIVTSLLIFSHVSLAVQVCKEVVSCQEVRKKLTKEEQKCLCSQRKSVVKTVVVEKEVVKVVDREVVKQAPKNNLSLLGGRTETGLKADSTVPKLIAHTTGEFDLGLMYQRSLGKNWKASAIGTKNGSFYGGLGYDF